MKTVHIDSSGTGFLTVIAKGKIYKVVWDKKGNLGMFIGKPTAPLKTLPQHFNLLLTKTLGKDWQLWGTDLVSKHPQQI